MLRVLDAVAAERVELEAERAALRAGLEALDARSARLGELEAIARGPEGPDRALGAEGGACSPPAASSDDGPPDPSERVPAPAEEPPPPALAEDPEEDQKEGLEIEAPRVRSALGGRAGPVPTSGVPGSGPNGSPRAASPPISIEDDYAEWCERHPKQAENDRRVLARVAEAPGLPSAEIAKAFDDLSQATIQNSLARLYGESKVQRERVYADGPFLYWTTEERDRIERERSQGGSYQQRAYDARRLRAQIEEILVSFRASEDELAIALGADRADVADATTRLLADGRVEVEDGRYRLREEAAA